MTSLEDHAAMRLAGELTEPVECTCVEYATLIMSQVEKIKQLEAKNKKRFALSPWTLYSFDIVKPPKTVVEGK